MTIANAIKKLSKYGEVKHNTNGQYWAQVGKHIVSFVANGEDIPTNNITCEHVRRASERDDYNSDYFPGSYFSNLTRAIEYATKY